MLWDTTFSDFHVGYVWLERNYWMESSWQISVTMFCFKITYLTSVLLPFFPPKWLVDIFSKFPIIGKVYKTTWELPGVILRHIRLLSTSLNRDLQIRQNLTQYSSQIVKIESVICKILLSQIFSSMIV